MVTSDPARRFNIFEVQEVLETKAFPRIYPGVKLFPAHYPKDFSAEAHSFYNPTRAETEKNDYLIEFKRISLVRRLGDGAFGVVHRGKDPHGRDVVVKRYWSNLMLHEQGAAWNEVEIASRLRHETHPNLVKVVGIFYDESMPNKLAIAFEYCNRGDLQNLLKNRDKELFTTAEVLKFFRGLTSALSRLHNHYNMIHRDLSLRNILVHVEHDEMILKIADYSLAKVLLPDQPDALPSEENPNTPFNSAYSPHGAPELHGETTNRTKAADVFSLGIIFLEIMLNRLLTQYVKKNNLEACLKEASQSYGDLVPIVASMLQIDREMRPSISEVEQQFESIASLKENEPLLERAFLRARM